MTCLKTLIPGVVSPWVCFAPRNPGWSWTRASHSVALTTDIKSVCETAPKSLFWASTCVLGPQLQVAPSGGSISIQGITQLVSQILIRWLGIYPLDSTILHLTNWSQDLNTRTISQLRLKGKKFETDFWLFTESIGGSEQGYQCCFTDIINQARLDYICDAG